LSDRALRTTGAVLALAGLGVASYLTYSHYADVAVACSTGGCETVLHSRYAKLAGIPVALLGAIAYLLIFCLQLVRTELAALVAAALAVAGLAFGAYLIVIQVAVVDALCQWCLTSDGVLTLLAVVSVWRVRCLLGSAQSRSSYTS
jgi:uncharacterized membrane protein